MESRKTKKNKNKNKSKKPNPRFKVSKAIKNRNKMAPRKEETNKMLRRVQTMLMKMLSKPLLITNSNLNECICLIKL